MPLINNNHQQTIRRFFNIFDGCKQNRIKLWTHMASKYSCQDVIKSDILGSIHACSLLLPFSFAEDEILKYFAQNNDFMEECVYV